MTGLVRELAEHAALALAGTIRERDVTAAEVIGSHLARIAERNPLINAVVAVAEETLDQAAARDRALKESRPLGPLHVALAAAACIEEALGAWRAPPWPP